MNILKQHLKKEAVKHTRFKKFKNNNTIEGKIKSKSNQNQWQIPVNVPEAKKMGIKGAEQRETW